jgi:DNA-binding LytR/AlgR family response regulator
VKKINTYRRNISVTADRKIVKIFLKDIIYVYHSNRATHIVTTDKAVDTYDTFRSVTEQLTGDCFVATHASCCVNLNYVYDYNRTDIICEYNGQIYKPFFSTRKYSTFNKRFREWSGERL